MRGEAGVARRSASESVQHAASVHRTGRGTQAMTRRCSERFGGGLQAASAAVNEAARTSSGRGRQRMEHTKASVWESSGAFIEFGVERLELTAQSGDAVAVAGRDGGQGRALDFGDFAKRQTVHR